MRISQRVLVATAGGATWLLLFGFVLFATSVMRDGKGGDPRGDGIVVLTGCPTRIAEGARLLQEGRARRLLISGINAQIGRDSVIKLARITEAKFDCCVDLGYAALDTVGNADETRKWVESRGYRRIIVVTSNFHMPRSMAELARALPLVDLIPHPVKPRGASDRPWWLQARTTRILVWEYLKFLPAAARLAAARVLISWESNSIAEIPTLPRSNT